LTATTDGTTPAEAAAIEGNTQFALDMYARLKATPGNLFFSPYSLSTALAMTSAGARGGTAQQMAGALHLAIDSEDAHAGFGALLARINGGDRPGPRPETLDSANALWLRAGEAFLPEFTGTVRTRYGAGLFPLDFAADPDAARETINAWVAEQTRGKIRELVGPGVLRRETSVVITNAVYFRAAWKSPFHESRTRKNTTFHAPGGRDTTVPMMAQTGSYLYLDGGTFQAVELPYEGDRLAMVVVLPRKNDGLGGLEASLTAANLSGWIKRLADCRVSLEMPRFTLAEGFDARDALVAQGMADAFDPALADFSGMTGRRDQFLSAVLHKAFVDLNEAGTEAAAATGAMMGMTMAVAKAPPVPFRADRPFVFFIRDRATGSVLFLGRCVDPNP